MESLDFSSLKAFAEPLAQLSGDEKTEYAKSLCKSLRAASETYKYAGRIKPTYGETGKYHARASKRAVHTIQRSVNHNLLSGIASLLSAYSEEFLSDNLSVSVNSGFPLFSTLSGTSSYATSSAPNRLKELPAEIKIVESAVEKVFDGQFPTAERSKLLERKYMERLVSLAGTGTEITDSRLYISPPKIEILREYSSSDSEKIILPLNGFDISAGVFSTYSLCFEQEKPSRFKKPPVYREDDSSFLSKIPLPGKPSPERSGEWRLASDFESRVKSYFTMKPVDVISDVAKVGKVTRPIFADRTIYGPFICEKNASGHKPFDELIGSQRGSFIFQVFIDSVDWEDSKPPETPDNIVDKHLNKVGWESGPKETQIRHLFCSKGIGERLAKIMEDDIAKIDSDVEIEYAVIEV